MALNTHHEEVENSVSFSLSNGYRTSKTKFFFFKRLVVSHECCPQKVALIPLPPFPSHCPQSPAPALPSTRMTSVLGFPPLPRLSGVLRAWGVLAGQKGTRENGVLERSVQKAKMMGCLRSQRARPSPGKEQRVRTSWMAVRAHHLIGNILFKNCRHNLEIPQPPQ